MKSLVSTSILLDSVVLCLTSRKKSTRHEDIQFRHPRVRLHEYNEKQFILNLVSYIGLK